MGFRIFGRGRRIDLRDVYGLGGVMHIRMYRDFRAAKINALIRNNDRPFKCVPIKDKGQSFRTGCGLRGERLLRCDARRSSGLPVIKLALQGISPAGTKVPVGHGVGKGDRAFPFGLMQACGIIT